MVFLKIEYAKSGCIFGIGYAHKVSCSYRIGNRGIGSCHSSVGTRTPGFRFDTGPSLFTRPDLVEELLGLANFSEGFSYQPLETICNYFFPDGSQIEASSDIAAFAQSIETTTGVNGEKLFRYLRKVKKLYETTGPIFLEQSLHRSQTYLNSETFKALFKVSPLLVLQSLHQYNQNFWKDVRLTQLFDRFATYNGSNPYEAPAILQVVSHLEHGLGAFAPKQGMYSIAENLCKAGSALGVQYHLDTPVQSIIVEDKRAVGIQTKGEKKRYDF